MEEAFANDEAMKPRHAESAYKSKFYPWLDFKGQKSNSLKSLNFIGQKKSEKHISLSSKFGEKYEFLDTVI